MKRFNPRDIEPKWQQIWDEEQTYQADLNSNKPKYIAMSMFNYPSGAGIHIGHAMNYTISDVMARYKRQQGYESYHPVGWDAFGLPAENYAIRSGVSPQQSMAKIIPDYHKQYKTMGWSNDWSKEISTHEPSYYKWTQWIFAEMYKKGLAYQDARMQWWCDKCQTVLANEQVIDGKCWRHDGRDDPLVEKKEVKQWFFKITDYAEELLDATDALDWSEVVKTAQKNWIGKSKGAEIRFNVAGFSDDITVFTTRPDTLFGVTFMVLAPEHELVSQITASEQKQAVDDYVKEAAKKTEIERQAGKEKTGVFTGAYAINPINNKKIPIWIADYVLSGYGTGAIMAVPAHDERDNEFAKKYDLPIINVVVPDFGDPLEGEVSVEGVVVIVYDQTKDRFLGIKTGTGQGIWLAGGGCSPGETFAEAAVRELAEETGFRNFERQVKLGDPVYSHYFNDIKKVARRSLSQGYLFFVDGREQGDPSFEAHEQQFKLDWYSFDSLRKGIERTGGGVEHWLDMLDRARQIINGDEIKPHFGEGVLINSDAYDGISSAAAREEIVASLANKGTATEKTTFKLRDWSVSRQRYWGAPIPIINCPNDGPVLVPYDQLPVVLPELEDFQPSGDGRSALARASDWLQTKCPQCGGMAERETDTLDTYICSSWYFLRYFDPENDSAIFESDIANKWMPIDFYNGGDHATAHMLYARFVTRFLHKQGLLNDPEPFKRFLFNGKVTASDGQMFSKSKGNGVDPLDIINQGYGADALRTYLMFASPLDLWTRWDAQGVPGAYRFLSRVWNITQEFLEESRASVPKGQNEEAVLQVIHPVIKKVTSDLEDQKFNTAIAAMMKATNQLYELKAKQGFSSIDSWRFAIESLVQLVAPFAPHTADELWQQLGNQNSVHVGHWPEWDEKYLVQDSVTIVVQVNGKLRASISAPADSSQEEVEALARADSRVAGYLGDGVKKVIFVPNKLINFVV